ncbi:MAG: GNAT family N-acetyltransferase [Solobacterium sp.]|nr:GNAT family N-acetyltransferase [Solobacterium sp.]
MAAEIIIRPFQREDAESFYQNVGQDPAFLEMSGLSENTGLREIREYIEQRAALQGREHFYDFAVVSADSGEVIGEINAAYIPKGIADVGYVIGPAYRNRGCGEAALRRLLEILHQERISVFYGACRNDNPASMRVLEKCGMKKTKVVPASIRRIEGEADLVYFVKAENV